MMTFASAVKLKSVAEISKNPDQQEPAVADGDEGCPPRENFVADAVLIFAGDLGIIQGIFGILNRNALRAAEIGRAHV